MIKKLIIISLALYLSACATSRGFDRGALNKDLGKDVVINDTEIERLLAIKPQMKAPFKLGVYFNSPQSKHWNAKAYWTGEDKEIIEEVGNRLIKEGVITQYVPIISSTVSDSDLKSVRLAAARYNVDAVLIINGIADIDTYNNNWASTYFLLITTTFVPGNVTDAIFLANATLWDVKNEYLYIAAESEGASTTSHPATIDKDNKVAMQAKNKAINELAGQLYKNIGALK